MQLATLRAMQGPEETRDGQWWVVCLCAAWCGACREWQAPFAREAGAHPAIRFAWVDIEDEADAIGEVDIETFPTILVACGSQVLFLGPVAPSGAQLARLVASLQAQPVPSAGVGAPQQALFARLRTDVLPHTPRVTG